MIVQNNSNPLNSLYYIGYEFLNWVKKIESRVFDVEDLYTKFTTSVESDMQFAKFLLLLDWLHMENCLDINENGEVEIYVFT